MGVWIETVTTLPIAAPVRVTPRVGVWIETCDVLRPFPELSVTPRVGVWIETRLSTLVSMSRFCHSPRGSVD